MPANSPLDILVIRLGAMGDIIHTLPAVHSLRLSFPESHISWAVAPKWLPLFEGNSDIDRLIPFRRKTWSELRESWRLLRPLRPGLAFDFQGLIQSALVGRVSRPARFFGWDASSAREPLASRFYSNRVQSAAAHVVDKNLELVAAAGAAELSHEVILPAGHPQGALPDRPFVLTHPFAGWASKQWPLEYYPELAKLLNKQGIALVANVSPDRAAELAALPGVLVHSSALPGLIDATRRAAAVVGLDSGPMHLAAALGKKGVALFGPTDPARNGPYGGSLRILRQAGANTSYKRSIDINPSMRAISAQDVYDALMQQVPVQELRS